MTLIAHILCLFFLAPVSLTQEIPGRSVFLLGRDFVLLSQSNLSLALDDTQAWVLMVHDEVIPTEIKEEAASLRGLIRFGMISRQDTRTLDDLNLDAQKFRFRALSYSSEEETKKHFDTDSFGKAVEFASSSVPDDKITRIEASSDIEDIVKDSVASIPAKITTIFLIRDKTPTLLHKVLSNKLSDYYKFGLITNAGDAKKLEFLKLGESTESLTVPGLFNILVRPSKRPNEDILTAPYDEESHGDINYVNVMRFLIEFNREYRHEMAGDNRATDKTTVLMTDVLEREKLIFSVIDMVEREQKKEVKTEL